MKATSIKNAGGSVCGYMCVYTHTVTHSHHTYGVIDCESRGGYQDSARLLTRLVNCFPKRYLGTKPWVDKFRLVPKPKPQTATLRQFEALLYLRTWQKISAWSLVNAEVLANIHNYTHVCYTWLYAHFLYMIAFLDHKVWTIHMKNMTHV